MYLDKKMFQIFLHLALFHSCTATKNTLPVFLMDYDNVMSHITLAPNPFTKLNENFFSKLVSDAVKRSDCVIIFAEETLCTEDLSLRDRLGTPFYNLQQGLQERKVLYLPAVDEPYDTLSAVFEPEQTKVFHLSSGSKLDLAGEYNYLYVYFVDKPDMPRVGVLRKHDVLMKEVYFAVRELKRGPVVAFYTGKENSVKLEQLMYVPLRTGEESSRNRGAMVTTPDVLLRLNGVVITKKASNLKVEETPAVVHELRTPTTLFTTLQYSDVFLQFFFKFEKETWKLAIVMLLETNEEVGRTQVNLLAPWGRSYYCAEPISIINTRDGSSITISEYQIEPLTETMRTGTTIVQDSGASPPYKYNYPITRDGSPSALMKKTKFSKPIHCGPYFNIAILSCQFIFLMFIGITIWGITMLLGCEGNNKFEDPNQKPLVIAQEAG